MSLASLRFEDLTFRKQGVLAWIRQEKQDRGGDGRTVAVPYGRGATCPITAIARWLERRGRAPGWLFQPFWGGRPSARQMEPGRIAIVVKLAAEAVGLDPARFAAHSLRAGFVTEALDHGLGEIAIARHTGHRSLSSLRRYYRPDDPFRANACASIGL